MLACILKAHPSYTDGSCNAFVCDLTMDELVGHIPAESVDLASLFFVLSAIAPDNMVDVLKNVFQVRLILH